MTKEEFSKLARLMGYGDKKSIECYCEEKPSDYVYTDDDFISLYRGAPGKRGVSCQFRPIQNGRTTKRYEHGLNEKYY